MTAIELVEPCTAHHQNANPSPSGEDSALLSDREVEVVYAWFLLGAKQDVANSLMISVSTVATHIERVREKYAELGRAAGDKTSLLLRMLEDGYLCFGHDRLLAAVTPGERVRCQHRLRTVRDGPARGSVIRPVPSG